MKCSALVVVDGRCVTCGRPAKLYGDRLEHVRGRVAGVSPFRRSVPGRPCGSTRGVWGGICPDCGARLPKPGPLRSWMAQRDQRFTLSSIKR